MRTSHSRSEPVIRAQGPEWAVFCDDSWLDPSPPLGGAPPGPLGTGADGDVYRTVLQVLDLSADPVEAVAGPGAPHTLGSRQPPGQPGRKQREYPHSSGDRNTFPPVAHPEKRNHGGGRQRVAPNDSQRGAPRRGGAH